MRLRDLVENNENEFAPTTQWAFDNYYNRVILPTKITRGELASSQNGHWEKCRDDPTCNMEKYADWFNSDSYSSDFENFKHFDSTTGTRSYY
jgi:hypothetical protein